MRPTHGNRSPSEPQNVADLVAAIERQLSGPFEQIELAETEIQHAAVAHPEAADLLYHSFTLLRPTQHLMSTPFVYQGHIRELLARILAGQDTRPGTAAEVCLVCRHISMSVPLNTAAVGLYSRMWHQAFPDHPDQMPNLRHFEALVRDDIDVLETSIRTTIGRREAWRHLTGVTCQGLHHGDSVACRFASPPR